MPEEPLNTEYGVAGRTESQETQEVDSSNVRDWKPSLKSTRLKGPGGMRSTCLFRASPRCERED
jgi:hypothetical protein